MQSFVSQTKENITGLIQIIICVPEKILDLISFVRVLCIYKPFQEQVAILNLRV